jgi:hypothetical protein
MNANALARRELLHIEGILAKLESFSDRNNFAHTTCITRPEYWKARIMNLCVDSLDADVGSRADKLLDRLSAIAKKFPLRDK